MLPDRLGKHTRQTRLKLYFGISTVVIVRSKLYVLKISGNCYSKISKFFDRVLTEHVEKKIQV